MTDRITRLKNNRKKVVKASENAVRDEAYQYAAEKYGHLSVSEQYAYGFAEALRRKSILIQEEDLLAGFLFQYSYNVNFPMIVSPDFDPADRAKFQMDVRREVREICDLFGEQHVDQDELTEFADAVESWLIKHWHSGHTLAGYETLLKKGFGGLLKEAKEEEARCQTKEEKETIHAFLIVTTACQDYIERYCIEAGKGTGENFRRMEEALAHIRTEPPRTFFEALQLVWLAHEMMYVENIPSAISIGRFDQYLYPYYKNDIEAGILTPEEAKELIQAFWIKCSSQKKAYQNLTLGGCDENGKCAVNELTLFCLESAAELRVDQPSVNYRWTDDQPDEVWEAILNLMRTGMGFPAIMYDPQCIKAQKHCGIADEDVWNYAFIGCVELGIPGKENALTELARLNLPKLLNLMLRQGRDVVSGKQFRMKNSCEIADIHSYEELLSLYQEEIDYWVRKILRSLDLVEQLYEKKYPLPFLSILTDDCIRRRKDVNAGGARYHSVGFNLCGMATAADSLMAIKKIVFDEKQMTLEQFVQHVDNDFSGNEELLHLIGTLAPKYGNDGEQVDQIAAEIEAQVYQILQEYRTCLGGHYRLGLYSVEDHAIMGMHTGATANGRRRGEALSNSTGATQGKDRSGPTALINSVTQFPMEKAENGMVLDVRFTPNFLEEKTGQNALKNMINTYFRKGGMEIQVSVVSRETLEAAQKHPEAYEDLIVRVSGFSAYFCSLRKATQDEIIRRTEN